MSEKFSILHISDLHRITSENVACVIASFEVEAEYYRAQQIPMPAFIVVSGDIVNGSNEEDSLKAKKEIQEQYRVASQFLAELCNIFLNGVRERVIIVPGNHDMSRYMSRASMTEIKGGDMTPLVNAIWEENTHIRWSWGSLSFHQITDENTYNTRFQDFIDFYNDFYKDSDSHRVFPTDPERQSYIVDFKDQNITFACFNSCYHLDHLQASGYISPNSLSSLSRELLDKKRLGRFIVAVWHHHTQGQPKENNYLNNRILDNMSKYGIKLALHGHQHISGILNEYRDIFTEDRMWLVSAGTVYGNQDDMVPGTNRQFNLMIANRDNTQCSIDLLSREDRSMLNPQPIWESGLIGRSTTTCYQFCFTLEPIVQVDDDETLKMELNRISMDAERTGDFDQAARKLLKQDVNNPMVRKYLLDYLQKSDNHKLVTEVFVNSRTVSEAIQFVDSCIKTQDTDALMQFQSKTDSSIYANHSVKAMLNEAKAILRI